MFEQISKSIAAKLAISLILLAAPGCSVLGIQTQYIEGCPPPTPCPADTQCDSKAMEMPMFNLPRIPIPQIPIPHIPTPGCVAKWRERRNLPEGPDGAKFHPLPTRPMFQPASSNSGSTPWCGEPNGFASPSSCDYGAMPSGVQWQFLDAPSESPEAELSEVPKSNPGNS